MAYALNDELDIKSLQKIYRKSGRVKVKNALDEASAEALTEALQNMAVWRWAFIEGGEERIVGGRATTEMTEARRRRITERLYTQAREGYQYLRFECPTDDIPDAKDPKALTEADVLFKSAEFRDLLRAVSGEKDGELEGVHARWLNRDKFMCDSALATNRPQCKLYFSMDLARDWKVSWGGQLNFLDDDGEIEEVWSPAFNQLNIYSAASRHSISYVVPFEGSFALSVCGRLV